MRKTVRNFLFVLTLVCLLAVIANAAVPSVKLGELAIAGNACQTEDVKIEKLAVENDLLQIPSAMMIKKISGESFRQGNCNFALPVSVPAGHKVVVSQLMAPGFVNLDQGTQGQMQLEVFKSGAGKEQLVYKETAEADRLRQTVLFEKDDFLFESECGEDFMLKGNATLSMNEGMRRSAMNLDLVQVRMEVVKCL